MYSNYDATPDTLMRQATLTADLYLKAAIRSIDTAFGEIGFARKHPAMVASFMDICAQDFATGTQAVLVHRAIDQIGSALDSVLLAFDEATLTN